MGFFGSNGAGKTSAVRMLSGVVSPTKGYATVAGFRTEKDVEELHGVIGFLTETPGFNEGLSAKRDLNFLAKTKDKIKKL